MNIGLIIDGEAADAASGATFERRDPVTGAVASNAAAASIADVSAVVASAARAFETWSKIGPEERRALRGLPDVHYGNAEHFVDAATATGMSKWTLTGTTLNGERKEVNGCDFYTFRDGKVIRKDSYWKIIA